MALSRCLWLSEKRRQAWQPKLYLHSRAGASHCARTRKASPGLHPGNNAHVVAVKLIQKNRLCLSLSVAPLSVSSSSPLCCPYRMPQLTSRRLCFCLDLWIEFFRGPTIKYGIEIAPLFLLRLGGGESHHSIMQPVFQWVHQVLPPFTSRSTMI